MNDDYDTPWKDALTRYFPEFMAFYFPAAYSEIDWSVPCIFLEQELAQVVHEAKLGGRRVDKLVKVATNDGRRKWVLVHVDVQASYDKSFAERIYVYNYRIYDRYRGPVASLAVLADGSSRWKPEHFHYELFGCQVSLRFPVVKLNEFAPRLDELLREPNVFGLVTAAHLLTQQTKGHDVERHAAKWGFVRMLYDRNWEKQTIVDVFNIIDWMMQIPPELESKLLQDVEDLERSRAMPYISSFEQRGLERGMERGLELARRDLSRLIARLLSKRYGALPLPVQERLAQASTEELQAWGEALIDAPTLESVFAPH
ncbi:MAG: DUF4351 domain-containing protein [Massilia sp.]